MAKPAVRPIETEHLTMRLLEEDDLALTLQWRNADRDRFFDSSYITKEKHVAWFKAYVEQENDFTWVAVNRDTNRRIAHGAIYEINWKYGTAEYGRVIVALEERSAGIGTEMTRALAEWAEMNGILDLHLDVFVDNAAAIRVYERCGFKRKRLSDDGRRMTMARAAKVE